MLHGQELSDAIGLPLEAVNWHTRDFAEIPGVGRYLLMGADGQFREPANKREVTEYFLGGEWYEVEEQQTELDEEDEGDLILWL